MVSIQYRQTNISHAQILALQAVPIVLVPAPSSNKAIVVHEVYATADTTAGMYIGGDNLQVRTEGAEGAWGEFSDDILHAGGPDIRLMPRSDYAMEAIAAGARVLLTAAGAPFAGGSPANTLSIGVWYSVVPA